MNQLDTVAVSGRPKTSRVRWMRAPLTLALLFSASAFGQINAEIQPWPASTDPYPSVLPSQGSGQGGVEVWEEYDKQFKRRNSIAALGPDLFGEEVNLANGALAFSATDLSIPGNSGLPVALTRSISVSSRPYQAVNDKPFADWELDVPRIEGTYGLVWEGPNDRCSRTTPPESVTVGGSPGAVTFVARAFWSGLQAHIPGGGELLVADSSSTPPPTAAGDFKWVTSGLTYFKCITGSPQPGFVGEGFEALTTDGTRYSFNSLAQYYETPLSSSGADSSSGTMSRRRHVLYATEVVDRFGNKVTYSYSNGPTERARLETITATGSTTNPSASRVIRLEYNAQGFIWKAHEQSGTTVLRTWEYLYNSSTVGAPDVNLTDVILPDDSRWEIDFRQLVDSEIQYAADVRGRNCKHNLPHIGIRTPDNELLMGDDEYVEGTIKHPAGAIGKFRAEVVYHTRANVPLVCENADDAILGGGGVFYDHTNDVARFTKHYDALTLTQKEITGHALTPMVWGYEYDSQGNWHNDVELVFNTRPPVCEDFEPGDCSAPVCPGGASCSSNTGATTTVTGPGIAQPDGSMPNEWTQYSFGNNYRFDEGKLLKVEKGLLPIGASSATVQRSESTEYQLPTSTTPGSIPAAGRSLRAGGDGYLSEHPRPRVGHAINQANTCFRWDGFVFDNYFRPTSVDRSRRTPGANEELNGDPDCSLSGSTLLNKTTESILYQDFTTLWVLGQTKTLTVTDSSTGQVTVPQHTDSYNLLAQPTETHAFGKRQQVLSYHADGLVRQISDASGSKNTTLSAYIRGIPTLVTYQDTRSESALVNGRGEITQQTGATGAVTNYTYDDMGRLTCISYPNGDPCVPNGSTNTWYATLINFAPMTASDQRFGLPVGSWKRTVKTGTGLGNTGYAVSETYYDGFWRPLLSREYDGANPGQTTRVVRQQFDPQGRAIFTSFPTNDTLAYNAGGNGSTSWYDGIGRMVRSRTDTELGARDKVYFHQNGFKTRVFDETNVYTDIQYQAFDQPSTDYPVVIDTAGNNPFDRIVTTISRDIYGKPLSISRADGVSPWITATRRYVYDSNQRLCRSFDPESNWTVREYDTSNNVSWLARGQLMTGASQNNCDQHLAPSSQRSVFSYDDRNRMEFVNHPVGTQDVSYSYEADGALKGTKTLDNGSPVTEWSYTYNPRRLLENESLTVAGKTYGIVHEYDPYGSRSHLNYPDGTRLGYAPNKLGQPTAVSGLASAVQYHPSGTVKSFTYANGLNYASTLNTRQLPASTQVSGGVLSDLYGWDAVGNLLAVTDLRSNPGQSRTRSLYYDSAHRLKNATYDAVGLGTYTFRYNGLDNITQATRPDGFRDYQYDDYGTRRLTQIVDQSNQQTLIGYQYDNSGNATVRDPGGLGFIDAYAFHYDRANRLTEVRDPQNPNVVKARYGYDGHARRASIIENDELRSQIYSQSGQFLFEEGDLISDADFSPGGNAAAKAATRYQYLGSMLIAKSSGGQTTYLHTDHLGSPVAESTAAPVQVTHLPIHEPYGAPTNNVYLDGPGYTGHVVDGLTGLSYMQARYYDPVAGRFLGVDPVGVGNGENFNRYWYANNNPYVNVDPDGRQGERADQLGRLALLNISLWNMRNHEDPHVRLRASQAAASYYRETGLSDRAREVESEEISRRSKTKMDPKNIRFLQDSISGKFQDGKGSLKKMVRDLRTGKTKADDIPPIRVFTDKNGQVTTLDHRRLHAFQQAGVPINTVKATDAEVAKNAWKRTTTNEGRSLRVRGKARTGTRIRRRR